MPRLDQSEQAGLRGDIDFAQKRWSFKRVVQEAPEISIDEELVPDQRHEPAQAPLQPAAQLQIPHQQQGDRCCPNLDPQRVGRRADEGLDLENLRQALNNNSICDRWRYTAATVAASRSK